MLEKNLTEIETRLQQARGVDEAARQQLLELLATVRTEVKTLADTHADEAHSIAGFTSVSTHEAIRSERNPKLIELALEGLSSSVTGFEESHPKLVQAVNRICLTLSNLGI
jgi:predicted transcriptional regulator